MNKIFITKEKLDNKLCIHCSYHEDIGGINYCSLKRSNVDGSPIYLCSNTRDSPSLCDGHKWIQKENIVRCDSQKQAEEMDYEYNVQLHTNRAIEILNSPLRNGGYLTNNYLEEAIKRVKQKNNSKES